MADIKSSKCQLPTKEKKWRLDYKWCEGPCQGLGSLLVNQDLITGYLITRVRDHTQNVKQRGKKDQDAGNRSTRSALRAITHQDRNNKESSNLSATPTIGDFVIWGCLFVGYFQRLENKMRVISSTNIDLLYPIIWFGDWDTPSHPL